MDKMSKNCIVSAVAKEASLTKAQTKAAYDALVKVIYKCAKAEDGLTLPGIGKFVKKVVPAHNGRNPKTGASVLIPEKTAVRFKLAPKAAKAIIG